MGLNCGIGELVQDFVLDALVGGRSVVRSEIGASASCGYRSGRVGANDGDFLAL